MRCRNLMFHWRASEAKPCQTREFPSALEGQIEGICRDLAVQVKRMRQLQEQADELRATLHEWAGADSFARTD